MIYMTLAVGLWFALNALIVFGLWLPEIRAARRSLTCERLACHQTPGRFAPTVPQLRDLQHAFGGLVNMFPIAHALNMQPRERRG